MPGPNLPSSFASAAAGQNSGRDRNISRGESRGSSSGDWLRRDGRSNGTAILRRSSTTPFNNSQALANTPAHPIDNSLSEHAHDPPQASAAFLPADSTMGKYSREDLLEIGRASTSLDVDVSALIMDGFGPSGHANGPSSRGWGKTNDTNGHNDPTICWNSDGTLAPLGLRDMSAEERELFLSDVNSPLKQQQQQTQQSKDGTPGPVLNGRKLSVSQGLSSPSGVPRPAARRRETADTNPFAGGGLASPVSAGPGRHFDAPWFNRRGTDVKESEAPDEEKHHLGHGQDSVTRPAGFSSLTRSSTTGAAGFGSPAWGTTTTPTTTTGFGGFGNFALNNPGADKGYVTTSGSSRFFSKKDSAENVGASGGPGVNSSQSWRPRPRTDTDPFGADEAGLSGSAALGGARDTSPPPMPTTHGSQIFDTPAKGNTSDFGMSGLNLSRDQNASSASPSQTNPFRSPPADRGDNDHDDLGFDKGHAPGGQSEQNSNFGSIRGFPAAAAAAAAFEGSDRSQTSSVGAKNYPALGNIGGWPSAFSTATPERERAGFVGPFGNSVFSPLSNEMPSPGIGSIGGLFGPTSGGLGGAGSVRGGSKLHSLFPAAMQAQMQTQEHEPLTDSVPDVRQNNSLNMIGAGAIGTQSRDTDSPLPMGRGVLDLFASTQSQVSSPAVFTTAEHSQNLLATAPQGHVFGPNQIPPFGTESAPAGPPQSQARTMVMPDRMRWMYMDPQGQQQGPFTGLEMNEWYKGNFFTNDLRVRKLEDPEFEPLGQLIRRIGNSREPFLVPQVGVPHGPPAQSGTFSPGGDARGVIPPLLGVVPSYGKTLTAEEQNNLERRKQEEQVAMARQREFMAQQTHFRPMHPGVPGVLQHQASMHSLQSQPSFGSITSPIGMPPPAPIGGNMGGPAPTPGFFDQNSGISNSNANNSSKVPGLPSASTAGSDLVRGELNEHERQILASLHGPGGVSGMFPPQPVGPPTAELKSQLPSVDQLERDPQGFKDRLKEFQEYQGIPIQPSQQQQQPQLIDEEALRGTSQSGPAQEQNSVASQSIVTKNKELTQQRQHQQSQPVASTKKAETQKQPQQTMSLTEQVQKAQADAAQAAHRHVQEDEAWGRQDSAAGLPMPFPAPLPASHTPLAAPTAQRRSNIADQYIETRSRSLTPDSAGTGSTSAAQAPPAPWARDPGNESQKGPSLKEIQEAEAVEAAKMEARRRAQAEQEALALKERERANPVIVPGLPQHSTWGSGSPAPSASSPWSKPAIVKTGVASPLPTTPGKKTLADIQREEENRKAKLAKEEAAKAGVPVGVPAMGKRYADLASKTGPPGITAMTAAAAPNPVAGGWSTVGAGGRVKIPPTGPQAVRSVSGATANHGTPPPPAQVGNRPVVPQARPSTATASSPAAAISTRVNSVGEAHAALGAWIKSQLSRGLKTGISVDIVVNATMDMGTEKELLEAVFYQALADDSVVDPRHLAAEYIRRKRQAEKGVFEPVPAAGVASVDANRGSAGWSEVAKKGGGSSTQQHQSHATKDTADVVGAGFKVVPTKKKGKK